MEKFLRAPKAADIRKTVWKGTLSSQKILEVLRYVRASGFSWNEIGKKALKNLAKEHGIYCWSYFFPDFRMIRIDNLM